jgi:meso-butanediol dehydrogenase/(S,S)-butanediol dehydrogenase/diacetyl reductase
MARFTDKVCVVTGGTYGIGFAVAERFLREGGRVVICSRDAKNVDQACLSLVKISERIDGKAVDISNRGAVDTFAEHISKRYGAVDVLVNNAFSQVGGTVAQTTDEQWHGNFAATLHGTFYMSRAMIPLMRGRDAAIVIISSVSGSLVVPGTAGYGAAKAGIEQLARVLAVEEAANGIRCNVVMVGGVATPALDKLVHGNYDIVGRNVPLGRVAQPSEIAGVVSFLASQDASYVTAATLRADGGLGAVMHTTVDQSNYQS